MAEIGYARVSTNDQNVQMQMDALKASGVIQTYCDTASGKNMTRPELQSCLRALRSGDTLVVWRLDRLGRNLKELISLVMDLDTKGVKFRSLTEAVDTSGPTGRLCFHIIASLAEFERELMKERTHAGLQAARARGRVGGRPSKLTPQQISTAKALMDANTMTITEIAKTFGVSRSTLYNISKIPA
ncbi:recombinase family protein [Comamonas testosteroni]|uniref:recombinase family protein n=1 Tax=Comamonas testosteroni TaxID=285 RepID=UPI0006B89454|nr:MULTISPECIES: recombinase family protein [Comamonas]